MSLEAEKFLLSEFSRPFSRFIKFSQVGFITFLLDFLLLFLFTDLFHIHYIFSAALAFIVAGFVNYLIVRQYVFFDSSRRMHTGFLIFLTIEALALVYIMGFLYVSVEMLEINYLISRVMVACTVGIFTYLLNMHLNFKLTGR